MWGIMATDEKNICNGFYKGKKYFSKLIEITNVKIETNEYIVVHLDGIKFTRKYFNKFALDVRRDAVKALCVAVKHICREMPNIVLAYVFSDEVSIIIDANKIISKDDFRLCKLVSKLASVLTLYFHIQIEKLSHSEIIELKERCFFSAKAFSVSEGRVEKYLKWRLCACQKLIFDKKEDFDVKDDWEKYGYLLSKKRDWNPESLDFARNYSLGKTNDGYLVMEQK